MDQYKSKYQKTVNVGMAENVVNRNACEIRKRSDGRKMASERWQPANNETAGVCKIENLIKFNLTNY